MSRSGGSFRSSKRAHKAALGSKGFIPHSRELLFSPAWTTMPVNTRRFVEFLEREHLKHAGKENGFLTATYNDLMSFGISRGLIKRSIDDACDRGLVIIVHHGGWHTGPALYQLTYLAWKLNGATGPEFIPPGNQWQRWRPTSGKPRSRKPASRIRLVVTNG